PLFKEYQGKDVETPEPAPAAESTPAPPSASDDVVTPPPLPPQSREQAEEGTKVPARPKPPLPFHRLTSIIVPRKKRASMDEEPKEETSEREPLPTPPALPMDLPQTKLAPGPLPQRP